MIVLGQFRVIGEPDHFVWLRGFADMSIRRAGLETFYGGPIWAKYRATANSMILDSDHVHLLHLLGSAHDLTCGHSAETVAAELEAGTISPKTGVVAVDFFKAAPEMVTSAAGHITKAYRAAGIQLRGCLTTELATNDYPRLPAMQTPGQIVIISVYETEALYRARGLPRLPSTVEPDAHQNLLLAPTLRSPLRW